MSLKNIWKFSTIIIVVLSVLIFLGQFTSVSAKYPERPITIVIPYDPGGGSDNVARTFVKYAQEILDVEFVYEYLPGAGGALGTTELSTRKPDGYTIATFNTPQIAIQPIIEVAEYDTFEDFDYLAQVGASAMTVATQADSPYDSLEDAIEAAKENPGTVNLGISGRFGTAGLVGLTIHDFSGSKFNIVQFESGAEIVSSVLGGHIDLGVAGISPFAGSKSEIKFLAVSSENRSSELPNVPTLREAGIPFNISAGRIFFAPMGLNEDVKEKLVQTFKEVFDNDNFQDDLKKLGIEPSWRNPAELETYLREIQEQSQRLAEVF